MKEQGSLTGFLKKNSHLGKWVIFGWTQKLWCIITAGRIFLKFCTMKGANRQMRMILIISPKKIVWGKWTILGPKVEGVCCFLAIAFYPPLSLILVLDLICQQNNNNKLYSKKIVLFSNIFITY